MDTIPRTIKSKKKSNKSNSLSAYTIHFLCSEIKSATNWKVGSLVIEYPLFAQYIKRFSKFNSINRFRKLSNKQHWHFPLRVHGNVICRLFLKRKKKTKEESCARKWSSNFDRLPEFVGVSERLRKFLQRWKSF